MDWEKSRVRAQEVVFKHEWLLLLVVALNMTVVAGREMPGGNRGSAWWCVAVWRRLWPWTRRKNSLAMLCRRIPLSCRFPPALYSVPVGATVTRAYSSAPPPAAGDGSVFKAAAAGSRGKGKGKDRKEDRWEDWERGEGQKYKRASKPRNWLGPTVELVSLLSRQRPSSSRTDVSSSLSSRSPTTRPSNLRPQFPTNLNPIYTRSTCKTRRTTRSVRWLRATTSASSVSTLSSASKVLSNIGRR
jgi:hypothetical protein